MKKLFTLLAAMIAAVTMMAQVTTSSISGTILNDNDQLLQGATVTATDLSTGTPYYAVSDVNGIYRLQNLRPGGPYALSVHMMGYHSQTIDNIKLGVGESLSLNVKMSIEDINLMEVTISPRLSKIIIQRVRLFILHRFRCTSKDSFTP